MSRTRRSKPMIVGSVTVTVVFLASFTIGGVYYFSEVYVPPGAEGVQVTGAVEHSYTFSDDDFAAEEVTIRAELIGSVTYVAPKNYTGVPLTAIIEHARPKASATTVEVTAKDGYTVTFDLDDVLADAELIMTHDEPATGYRLIAANYDGAYWVEDCYKLEVR